MYFLQIWFVLLLGTALSIDPAPMNQNGAAIVVNECDFPVYFKSVGNDSVFSLSTISPQGTYQETFRLNIVSGTLLADGTVDGELGGISIKLSSNQTIANSVNESLAFDQSTITQFEYKLYKFIFNNYIDSIF
jgi:hypothetical protein